MSKFGFYRSVARTPVIRVMVSAFVFWHPGKVVMEARPVDIDTHSFLPSTMSQHRPVVTLDSSPLEGTWTGYLLEFVEYLDVRWGADQWSLRQVAIVTAVLLAVLRTTLNKRYGIDWYPMVHAMLTGYLSLVAVWISFSAETLTGTPEPLRSVLCQGPLTSLHRFVPAITMGYGLFDIVDGFSHGIDFLLHGLATSAIMAYFCEYHLTEIVVPFLLMEISSVHLSMMRAQHFSERTLAINMALFTLTFFIFRIVVCPYLLWEINSLIWQHQHDPVSQACLPWHFKIVVSTFSSFFSTLNVYWFYKIVRKLLRKLTGEEKVKDKNDLKDS